MKDQTNFASGHQLPNMQHGLLDKSNYAYVSPPRILPQTIFQPQAPKQAMYATPELPSKQFSTTQTSPCVRTPVWSLAPTPQATPPSGTRVLMALAPVSGYTTPPTARCQMTTPATTMPIAPTINIPLTVLTQLDQQITEMSSELAEIEEAGKQQEPSDLEVRVMDRHLIGLRQILAQDLLREHDQRKDLVEARMEEGMSDLELEVLALRRQVRELHVNSAASGTDDNLAILKSEMRQVLNNCQMLQSRVQTLELEKMRHEQETQEREATVSGLEAQLLEKTAELDKMLIDLERSIVPLATEQQAPESNHSQQIQSLSAKIQDLTHDRSIKMLEHDRDKQLLKEYEQQLGDLLSVKPESSRLQELEQLLIEAQAREVDHKKQISTLLQEMKQFRIDPQKVDQQGENTRALAEINKLKHQVEVAMSERDSMARDRSRHKQQVIDYEQQLNDFRTAEAKSKKQQVFAREEAEQCADALRSELSKVKRASRGFETKVQELEMEVERVGRLLKDHDGQLKEHSRHKQLVIDYEQQLEDHRTSEAKSKKQHALARQEAEQCADAFRSKLSKAESSIRGFEAKVQELEMEVERVGCLLKDRDGQLKEHSRHKQLVIDYEQQLEDFRIAEVKSKRQQELARQEAEQCADALRSKLSKAESASRGFETKVQELEMEVERVGRLLKDRDGQLEHAKRSHNEILLEVESLRRLEGEQAQQVIKLENERNELATRLASLKDRDGQLEHAKRSHNEILLEVESLRRLESEKAQQVTKLENERNDLATRFASSLNVDGRSEGFQSTSNTRRLRFEEGDPLNSTTHKSMADSRKSLAGYAIASKLHLVDAFMLGETDPFITKVRDAVTRVNDTLEKAMMVSVKCLEDQLRRLSEESRSQGIELRSLASEGVDDLERRAATDMVEATSGELRAIELELSTEHHLSSQARERADERIRFEMGRCEDVLKILRLRSPLESTPENVLQMLVRFCESQESAEEWAGRPAPTHWAAENGRRDVMIYLLQSGYEHVLSQHDDNGRSPFYYAQLGKQESLIVWLRDVLELDATAHRQEDVPTFTGLSQSHASVLQKIVANGWRSMTWKDGRSMLHWAADKGREDLAKYLVSLDANPNQKDATGQSPIDIATAAGNESLVKVLKDLRAKRRQSRVSGLSSTR